MVEVRESEKGGFTICVLGAQRHRLIPVFIYGLLRDDFSIVLGQLISYYIYLWNLNAKGVWKRLGLVLQSVLLATPVVAVLLMLQNAQVYFQNFSRMKIFRWDWSFSVPRDR